MTLWHITLPDGTIVCDAKYPGLMSTHDFRGVVATDQICPDCQGPICNCCGEELVLGGGRDKQGDRIWIHA